MKNIHLFRGVILVIIINCIKPNPEETAQVEVRAVLINCESGGAQSDSVDNEATRFEREESFKHSVLRDCRKKLALTVKIASDPNQNLADEFIPIEHVFQGPQKRVRLLNPYVLRLRREAPLQAYKLRKIETVTGVLANTNGMEKREKRDVEISPDAHNKGQNHQSYSEKSQNAHHLSNATKDIISQDDLERCGLTPKDAVNSMCLNKRDTRHELDTIEDEKKPISISNEHRLSPSLSSGVIQDAYDETPSISNIDTAGSNSNKELSLRDKDQSDLSYPWNSLVNEEGFFNSNQLIPEKAKSKEYRPDIEKAIRRKPNKEMSQKKRFGPMPQIVERPHKDYDMYEIGNADLWYTVQVQLFEKIATPEGKTVWNDLSKSEQARVGSFSPDWSGQDVSVRYRSSEWIPRKEFSLPVSSLCLLSPIDSSSSTTSSENAEEYIVVPSEDVMDYQNENKIIKRDDKYSKLQPRAKPNAQSKRRVLIRTTRALLGDNESRMRIVPRGHDQFLTLVHRKPYHAQIDLEARADDNQLVHVGSSGRIMTVVSDSSRRMRSTLTVQVTNTGLASARFRVVTRDCNPELPIVLKDNSVADTDSSILVPPKHTRSIKLDVPTDMPVDCAHCSVVLVNGDEQSVAARDVTIKKGDRCFCVWHCECVCLSEDPKLLCREMPEARQIAAGLSLRERTRHVRSVCYHDMVSLDLCVAVFGVLLALLLFGLVKACMGLVCRCVGSWGMSIVLQMPRKLDHYYESSFRDSPVVCDDEGWPVHPETKKRTVRLVSRPMEFILNLTFFITAPCIIIHEVIKQLVNRCRQPESTDWKQNKNEKALYSTHDIQGSRPHRRQRRTKLQRWMTPEAQELSRNLWQEGLPIQESIINDCMQPLLQEGFNKGDADTGAHAPAPAAPPTARERCAADSEADETDYVLTQMQKSKESLARSQRKLNDPTLSPTKNQ